MPAEQDILDDLETKIKAITVPTFAVVLQAIPNWASEGRIPAAFLFIDNIRSVSGRSGTTDEPEIKKIAKITLVLVGDNVSGSANRAPDLRTAVENKIDADPGLSSKATLGRFDTWTYGYFPGMNPGAQLAVEASIEAIWYETRASR